MIGLAMQQLPQEATVITMSPLTQYSAVIGAIIIPRRTAMNQILGLVSGTET